jgi:hypothetical protein
MMFGYATNRPLKCFRFHMRWQHTPFSFSVKWDVRFCFLMPRARFPMIMKVADHHLPYQHPAS